MDEASQKDGKPDDAQPQKLPQVVPSMQLPQNISEFKDFMDGVKPLVETVLVQRNEELRIQHASADKKHEITTAAQSAENIERIKRQSYKDLAFIALLVVILAVSAVALALRVDGADKVAIPVISVTLMLLGQQIIKRE